VVPETPTPNDVRFDPFALSIAAKGAAPSEAHESPKMIMSAPKVSGASRSENSILYV
jgi:hypothetical protein